MSRRRTPDPAAAGSRVDPARHVETTAFSEGGGVMIADRADARGVDIDDDELVLLALSPSLWFVPMSCLGSLLAIACGIIAMGWATRLPVTPWTDSQAVLFGLVLALLRLGWQLLEWSQRLYVLTDRRVIRRSGVLRAREAEERLQHLRHTVVVAARRERAIGVGTVAFVVAGSGGLDWSLAWETINRPDDAQRAVREAIERYGR